MSSVPALLARRRGDHRPAILAPDHLPLTYAQLGAVIDRAVDALHGVGVGRGDRVGIVLPNGPAAAVVTAAVATAATAAPLNPAYSARELTFYLADLGARAVVVPAQGAAEARAAAAGLGALVIEAAEGGPEAGAVTLSGPAGPRPSDPALATPADIALVLHTSGTTSRPKIVPLRQQDIMLTAANICARLELTQRDRSLNVMPLFHVHGLINSVLATLWAGGSVVCTPGFQPGRFFDWLGEYRPTWYTAVPTLHQAVLREASRPASTAAQSAGLRFVRSSSSPLPPRVYRELEALFGSPVIESYGMTEVDQITCNPLPPAVRKPGSVGLPGGPQVAIMTSAGALLPHGAEGEVVVRGANVMAGYEAKPEVNRAAFCAGWFRTGDLGALDDDGYLFLHGRIKEIIDRGGEKISPREVDDVLLDHPSVLEAATFPLAHPVLVQEVAAAVVLRPGASLAPHDLRVFAAERLAGFKVPSRVVVVDAIPKGPTGKLQRDRLAEQLGLPTATADGDPLAPRDALEQRVAAVWASVLGLGSVGVLDDFMQIGGTSLLAYQVVQEIGRTFRRAAPGHLAATTSTVAEMAAALRDEGWSAAAASP
jgi:acyl-CoA synthetase (AMP-forming)/AMP-acid ligase II